MAEKKPTRSGDGWIAPRDGGYRPGKTVASGARKARVSAKHEPPPKGGAGIGRWKGAR